MSSGFDINNFNLRTFNSNNFEMQKCKVIRNWIKMFLNMKPDKILKYYFMHLNTEIQRFWHKTVSKKNLLHVDSIFREKDKRILNVQVCWMG